MTKPQQRSSHRLRLPPVLALTAALGLSMSLAACGASGPSDNNSAASTTAASTPAASPSTTPPAPATTVPVPATTPSSAPSSTESAPAAATPLCTAADLTGSLGDGAGAGAGAGQLYRRLVVTNTSAADCILDGYPGVSMIMAGTTEPLGEPAVRDAQAPSNGPITLAPGSAASATLHYSQASNYQDCQRVEANAIMVYPPSATDSLEIPDSLTACNNAGITLLTIGAFQP